MYTNEHEGNLCSFVFLLYPLGYYQGGLTASNFRASLRKALFTVQEAEEMQR
jgi:hypothetical protein